MCLVYLMKRDSIFKIPSYTYITKKIACENLKLFQLIFLMSDSKKLLCQILIIS